MCQSIQKCAGQTFCPEGLGPFFEWQVAGDDDCDDDGDCTPANAAFWNSLDSYRGAIRRSGRGSKTRFYTWDRLHYCEVEVFDRRGNHLGSVDGMTGQPIPGKGPKPTHSLDL